jgi:predicted nucleic acid-binding protein
MGHSEVARVLAVLIEGGVVATCEVLDAEALVMARSAHEFEQIRADRRLAYEYLPTDDEHWQLALDAHGALARSGLHRAVGIADLLTAVIAAKHHLTVVHYGADFEIATSVIGFTHPAGGTAREHLTRWRQRPRIG